VALREKVEDDLVVGGSRRSIVPYRIGPRVEVCIGYLKAQKGTVIMSVPGSRTITLPLAYLLYLYAPAVNICAVESVERGAPDPEVDGD
jgi:hypothetical protein